MEGNLSPAYLRPPMVNPDDLKRQAAARKDADRKLILKLKRTNPREVDRLLHAAHNEVFACTDCLQCANCCRTTGPRFTDRDMDRIAKHLRIKVVDLIATYLRVDEDGDHVLQRVPCAFLGDDNMCSIYDVRPKACREYPHTDREKQHQLFDLTLRNVAVCPAVAAILDRVAAKAK
jgi:Fe-S-cluster containining protein